MGMMSRTAQAGVKALTTGAMALAMSFPAGAVRAQDDPVAEAIIDYMDFATYEAGILLPAQVDQSVFDAATFVDTRDAAQFDAGHIPGAINIEWRQVAGQLAALPDGMVILYCNTGSLSAQATFAARLMGYENVVVLQGGFNEWQESAAYRP